MIISIKETKLIDASKKEIISSNGSCTNFLVLIADYFSTLVVEILSVNHWIVRTYYKREFRWLGGINIFIVFLLLLNLKEFIIFWKIVNGTKLKRVLGCTYHFIIFSFTLLI